jgi:hypothetical protein
MRKRAVHPIWLQLGAALVLAAILPGRAQSQVDLGALQDEAVQWLQEYIRVNTVNPPGNEIRGAEFFAKIFDAEGIDYEIAESAPGRGNIWARIEGGIEPGLVLLHHMDVVPADERFWTTEPFSGELRDGYIHGRGALDTKTSGILHLVTFLALQVRPAFRLIRSAEPVAHISLFPAGLDQNDPSHHRITVCLSMTGVTCDCCNGIAEVPGRHPKGCTGKAQD